MVRSRRRSEVTPHAALAEQFKLIPVIPVQGPFLAVVCIIQEIDKSLMRKVGLLVVAVISISTTMPARPTCLLDHFHHLVEDLVMLQKSFCFSLMYSESLAVTIHIVSIFVQAIVTIPTIIQGHTLHLVSKQCEHRIALELVPDILESFL